MKSMNSPEGADQGGIPIVDQVAGDESHANTATWPLVFGNKIGLEDEIDTVISTDMYIYIYLY